MEISLCFNGTLINTAKRKSKPHLHDTAQNPLQHTIFAIDVYKSAFFPNVVQNKKGNLTFL